MLEADMPHAETAFEFTDALIADSQLAMIFAVCHPGNATQSQVCLALQVLCGFCVGRNCGHLFDRHVYILPLYNQLLLIDQSPMVALNRAFVVAKIWGPDKAIQEVEQLDLHNNSQYHSLLGYLYGEVNANVAISHYSMAVTLSKSRVEKQTLAREIKRLQDKL